MLRRLTPLAVLAAALALAPAAAAHVTVHPNSLPAGSFTVVDVTVPNERQNAATTRVELKLPPGVFFLSTQPVAGWKAQVVYRKLARPTQVHGSEITQEADRVIWSGGRIEPGQFQRFPLSIRVPDRAGSLATFKALQTYSSGEIVRWIGPPGADEPAPQVALTAADSSVTDVPGGVSASTGGHGGSGTPAAQPAQASTDGGSTTRENVALGLAAAALAVALALTGVAVAGRRRMRLT